MKETAVVRLYSEIENPKRTKNDVRILIFLVAIVMLNIQGVIK